MSGMFSDRLQGRWLEILPQLGIPPKYLNGKHGPCPMCTGKDRFRFAPDKGLFICTHCGGGDGIKLVMLKNGWDFREAAIRIEPLIGAAKFVQPKPVMSDFAKRKELNDLWRRSKPITINDPAGMYLTCRTGLTEYPKCLRYVDSLKYWNGGTPQIFPAMLAMVSGPDGKPVSIYRTYLTHDGCKAPVDPCRRMMPGSLPKGYAVRLYVGGDVLGISEGIESGISASLRFGVPVWPTLGTSGIKAWMPPLEVSRVIVFGDCDAGYAGQAAAYEAAYRLLALPNRKLDVDVCIPGHVNEKMDWNDVHMKR
jgi:putative DNA primase/helicase